METPALGKITFYDACMAGMASPGFVAERVQVAGSSIKELGDIVFWAGSTITEYSWIGTLLAGLAWHTSANLGWHTSRVITLQGGNPEITNLLLQTRLLRKETTPFAIGVELCLLVIGVGTALAGAKMAEGGNYLASRETQCNIGNGLAFYNPKKTH